MSHYVLDKERKTVVMRSTDGKKTLAKLDWCERWALLELAAAARAALAHQGTL
jgi:hypothetical protein